MGNKHCYIFTFIVVCMLLTGCRISLSRVELDGYYQDYNFGDKKTVNVGSVMLSKIVYKNSCYDYISLVDYVTPAPGFLEPVTLKKGNQYPACFKSSEKENYVFIKGIHAFDNIILGINKNGTIGDQGGWYNAGLRMVQSSWPSEKIFTLSDNKYFPGFDTKNERFIYLGMTDGKIRIGYRVNNNNASKSDESQDIIHDLRDGNTVTYLNYTLNILNATSSSITFAISK